MRVLFSAVSLMALSMASVAIDAQENTGSSEFHPAADTGRTTRPVQGSVTATIEPCPASPPEESERPTQPTLVVANISFEGTLQLDAAERDQIAASLRGQEFDSSLDFATDTVLELVQEAWQDRGYFKVQVSGEAKVLTSSPVNRRIGITARVEEGPQYRMGRIRFNNNKIINDAHTLRQLFAIDEGEILDRRGLAEGLEKLKKLYMQLGYINFTSVPTPSIDEDNQIVSFDMDMDEGKQFFISSINLIAEDEQALENAFEDPLLQPGQVYNQTYIDLLSRKDVSSSKLKVDESRGWVSITVDLRQCRTK